MKKRRSLLTFILYLLAIALICSFLFIYYFNQKLGPGLITCAEDEVKHLTTLVMNNCIRKYINQTEHLDLIKIEKNDNEEIERIQYDTKILNQTRTKITTMLENDLDYMVKGNLEAIDLNPNKLSDEYYEKTKEGILFTVSMGSSTGNSLLANIGPKIPLNLQTVGEVMTNINTKITEYGMNNALIEVNIELEATTVIHMPFLSKKVTVKNTIPLTMEIIKGNIPSYYLGNNLTTKNNE